MAESIVQVNSGAGPKLHTFQRTIGANNVEDEVVVLGEQYLASFIMSLGPSPVSIATVNAHAVQIMAGASNKVRIRRIEISQTALATAAALAVLQVMRLTTAGTGGTVFTPAPLDTADTATATAMTLPTVKGTEGAILWSQSAYFLQTAAASLSVPQPLFTLDFDRPRSKPFIIPAGTANGMAIKVINAVAAAQVLVNVWLDESNF